MMIQHSWNDIEGLIGALFVALVGRTGEVRVVTVDSKPMLRFVWADGHFEHNAEDFMAMVRKSDAVSFVECMTQTVERATEYSSGKKKGKS